MSETHVVFGATGALGSAIVRRLASEGKTVRAVVRDLNLAKELLPASAGIVVYDVLDPERARMACEGATVAYHCVNVRYSQWDRVMPVVTENLIAAARTAQAKMVFPGDVYGYGPLQRVPAREDHPLAATSKKGRLRNRLEARLMEAHRAGDVPVVIPRFPDLYGPNVTNPLIAPIFRQARDGGTAAWPGRLNVPHDLIAVDDAARGCVLLAETEECYGQSWHLPGAGPLTGRQFIEMAFKAAGTRPKMRAISPLLFRIFGAFIPDAGEMVEIMYQFEQPLLLDGSKFAAAFPDFRYTPHEEAVAETMEWFKG